MTSIIAVWFYSFDFIVLKTLHFHATRIMPTSREPVTLIWKLEILEFSSFLENPVSSVTSIPENYLVAATYWFFHHRCRNRWCECQMKFSCTTTIWFILAQRTLFVWLYISSLVSHRLWNTFWYKKRWSTRSPEKIAFQSVLKMISSLTNGVDLIFVVIVLLTNLLLFELKSLSLQ